jgi:hypothetical protein
LFALLCGRLYTALSGTRLFAVLAGTLGKFKENGPQPFANGNG